MKEVNMKLIKVRGLTGIKKINLQYIRGGAEEEFDCQKYCNTYQVIIHGEFASLPDVLRKHV